MMISGIMARLSCRRALRYAITAVTRNTQGGANGSPGHFYILDGKMGKQNGQRALTNAERQAKWRLARGHKKAASDASRPKRALMVTCIPRGPLDLGEIDKSAGATPALF
jgi:hypothetical protein